MDGQQFWQLIEAARGQVTDAEDAEAVARRACALLAERPVEEIVAAQQALWDVMARSYTNPLWAAAYVVNGGCSDDGFDYFRGWLIAQGREVFERVTADPDALAELPVVRAAADEWLELECEEVLGIAWSAHLTATGEQLPAGALTITYPPLDPSWSFDFDDSGEMARRLPRLAALHRDQPALRLLHGTALLHRSAGSPLLAEEVGAQGADREEQQADAGPAQASCREEPVEGEAGEEGADREDQRFADVEGQDAEDYVDQHGVS
ncbi:DUF4240 domain-containing protein [Streptomyces sp. NPDC057616]|uniref:DUF4240 domain-containing protein n=1 Tax=Streptomyces sp. NPDC057616 TaxID=3346183 RepID=UPI0036ADAAFC